MQLVTNRLERLAVGSSLVLRRPGMVVDETVVVEGARPHSGRHLVRFAGVADIDAAEALRNGVLLAEPLVGDGALFVHELIGAEVVDTSGDFLGRVEAVEANPASDLLVLDGGGLVPLVFVVGRDGDRVVVDPPDGLLA